MNQSTQIKQEILDLIDSGLKSKKQIYTRVVENLHIARPTVRRAARELKMDLQFAIKILNGEFSDKVKIDE